LSKKPKLDGLDSEEDNSIVNRLQTLKSQDDILNCLDEIILILPTAYVVSSIAHFIIVNHKVRSIGISFDLK
jgi:hypothetical protein